MGELYGNCDARKRRSRRGALRKIKDSTTMACAEDAMAGALSGRRIAVPETRDLDLFVRMLEERGAETLRCPMVGIADAPDPAPVEAWLRRFAAGSCTVIVIYTGEGLRRLVGAAGRAGLKDAFVGALAQARRVTRGPKPARALREIGLAPDLPAAVPTTDGLIAALSGEPLAGQTVGVQLYPGDGPLRLIGFLEKSGARPDPVAPYVYVPAASDAQVIDLIDRLAAGAIDAIAFTSAPQVRRLAEVARESGRAATLSAGLARTRIAAVGPVVAAEIAKLGARAEITPTRTFALKPLIAAIEAALGGP
jgi:uroporphyrinogen-III synthase